MTPVFRGKQLRVHSYCGNSLKLRPKSTPLLLLYTTARGPHYDADATMAVPEPNLKQLLHLISCERYRELQGNCDY